MRLQHCWSASCHVVPGWSRYALTTQKAPHAVFSRAGRRKRRRATARASGRWQDRGWPHCGCSSRRHRTRSRAGGHPTAARRSTPGSATGHRGRSVRGRGRVLDHDRGAVVDQTPMHCAWHRACAATPNATRHRSARAARPARRARRAQSRIHDGHSGHSRLTAAQASTDPRLPVSDRQQVLVVPCYDRPVRECSAGQGDLNRLTTTDQSDRPYRRCGGDRQDNLPDGDRESLRAQGGVGLDVHRHESTGDADQVERRVRRYGGGRSSRPRLFRRAGAQLTQQSLDHLLGRVSAGGARGLRPKPLSVQPEHQRNVTGFGGRRRRPGRGCSRLEQAVRHGVIVDPPRRSLSWKAARAQRPYDQRRDHGAGRPPARCTSRPALAHRASPVVAGSLTTNTAPPSGRFAHHTSPPWLRTVRWTMLRPSPLPVPTF